MQCIYRRKLVSLPFIEPHKFRSLSCQRLARSFYFFLRNKQKKKKYKKITKKKETQSIPTKKTKQKSKKEIKATNKKYSKIRK